MPQPLSRKIVVVDDEPEICWLISRILGEEGYLPFICDNGPDGLERIKAEHPDLVLLDLRLPGMEGLEVLRRLREFDREIMVIILSAFESFEAAVQAMKLGSYDFLTKPINIEEMKITIKNALVTKNLVLEVENLKRQVEKSRDCGQIIGGCQAMQELVRQIELAGQHSISVLILGESGTGKELAARAVHMNSSRRERPFVCIDCSTIPENLVESELFGYEKGAFTGAQDRKIGRLEMAHTGTLFLDEIGNIPLTMQAKLLRVLQERTLYRLGGKTPVHIDVRIITATNVDLKQSLVKGGFREDLFYRLNEFPLKIPPLRERGDDIFMLAAYFLDRFNTEFRKQVREISPAAKDCLAAYAWPGNVRELQAVIKRAVILARDVILPEHLPPEVLASEPGADSGWVLPARWKDIRPIKEVAREVVARVERELIVRTLERTGGNKIKTARCLGIDYKTLFNKLKQYAIVGRGRRARTADQAETAPDDDIAPKTWPCLGSTPGGV